MTFASLGALGALLAAGPTIHVEDVTRFYQVYDAAGGHPTADQLQHDYLDAGSQGLHRFAELRNITGVRIAENLEKHPEVYSDAKHCMAVLPRGRERLQAALQKLGDWYPQALFPPVTIAVGRGRPLGVGTRADGVMIGLELLCSVNLIDAGNVEDRFVHTVAHEYVHVQQVPALNDDPNPTVLEGSLVEGGAEFVGELISGSVSYTNLAPWAKGREKEIESAFVPDEDKTDLSAWLYNRNPDASPADRPGDLGYWVGYRIAKSYYQHAADKRRAVADIIGMSDPKAFLAQSGWYPGIVLEATPRAPPASNGALIGIDHIPLVVKDLDRATRTYQRLGFAIKPGRFHADGIRNAHVKYPDGAGIELITADQANDALTRQYLGLLSAGEGPAFVSFHVADLAPVTERLGRSGLDYSEHDGLLDLRAPALEWLFLFAGTNQSPTDRPENFAHPNTADATSAVWIAVSDATPLVAFFTSLGAQIEHKQVFVPEPRLATVVQSANGEIILLPASRQLLAGRPIVGVVFHVRDLDATRRVLRAGNVQGIRQLQTTSYRSVFVPPSQTHGVWLEFRQ